MEERERPGPNAEPLERDVKRGLAAELYRRGLIGGEEYARLLERYARREEAPWD